MTLINKIVFIILIKCIIIYKFLYTRKIFLFKSFSSLIYLLKAVENILMFRTIKTWNHNLDHYRS